jgi:hypothetical protein
VPNKRSVRSTPLLGLESPEADRKDKAISVTDHGGPDVETSRRPHCLHNRLTDGGEVVSLTHQPAALHSGIFLVLICVRGGVGSTTRVLLGGLHQLKNEITSSELEFATSWQHVSVASYC